MKKLFKTGLIIGKFQPFHKGHQFLLETAINRSEKVSVIICQNSKNSFDPNVRENWIKELYPQVDVKICIHNDRLDSISTDISQEWADITQRLLGFVPEAVFSSEKYGIKYAKCMGSKHVLVDIDRKIIPISGSLVRSNPFKYWEFISEPVRAYYAKRVVILGAESTGTTTLAKSLANYYHTSWVPEYGRTYSEGRASLVDQEKWTSDEFVHIAKTQNTLENFFARKANKLLVCDTDAFATRLWHERYIGFLLPTLDTVANTENKSLYILTEDEIPFVQDGTRDGEKIRHKMHQRFKDELTKHNLKFITVSGSPKIRQRKAVREIDKLFTDQ
jgi:NadR type nicotinamide-nucleotide adenylyltransferase